MSVVLKTAYLGYTNGELTGNRNGYQYEIRLGSGKLIYLYEDEFGKN